MSVYNSKNLHGMYVYIYVYMYAYIYIYLFIHFVKIW